MCIYFFLSFMLKKIFFSIYLHIKSSSCILILNRICTHKKKLFLSSSIKMWKFISNNNLKIIILNNVIYF